MKLGIDLGTTFSAAAYMDANGVPQIVVNSEGERLTPSVIMEDENESIIVGETAKESAVIFAESVVIAAKDFMGTDRSFNMPSGKRFTPEEISGFILKKLRQDAEHSLGQYVTDVIITVPAYFTDAQRKATVDAGRIAGLNVLGMINEPTAAAIYFAYVSGITDVNVLVYDLGGGTFDVSIVNIQNGRVAVKATAGIRKLGGHFFDQMILNYVADYLLETHNLDVYDGEHLDELQELAIKSENCKHQLSVKESSAIVVKIGDIKEKLTITRDQFEEMIEPFYLRTKSTVGMVLDDAGMTWDKIDKVLLMGGSSRIPYIAAMMKELSGREPSREVNPDEAVALGAAIYANGGFSEVLDVNSHSLGIVTIDVTGKQRKNTIIIPKDSVLPVDMARELFTVASDADKIIIEITEGEDEDVESVNILASVDITLPPHTPKHTSVSVEMRLDKNQLLHIFARIASTPEVYKEIHIERKSNLSDEDIAIKTALVSSRDVL